MGFVLQNHWNPCEVGGFKQREVKDGEFKTFLMSIVGQELAFADSMCSDEEQADRNIEQCQVFWKVEEEIENA